MKECNKAPTKMSTMKIIPGILISSLMLITNGYAKDTTELDCLVKPEMYIDISSPVDGVLESVLVKQSDSVKKGQELAKLEASIEIAKIEVAQQEASMDKQVYAKWLRVGYAKRKKQRIAGLFKKKVISAQEQDDAVTELALTRTELVQIKLDKKKNELKLLLAKAGLEQKTIKSPIDGIVVQRYLMPGESVDNQPILQLAKIDPLLVEVVAPAHLFSHIKPGMSVEIRPDAPANSSYQATVSIVDRIIDAASGSFTIKLALPNPDDKLVGGTKCIALFPIKSQQTNKSRSIKDSALDALPEDIRILLGE